MLREDVFGEEASDPILPLLGIAGSVEDGNHGDRVLLQEEEHLIREPLQQRPADIPVQHRILMRVAQDGLRGRIYSLKEIRTKAENTTLLPVEGLCKFRFRLGPDDQTVVHLRLAILSRTTGQGTPPFGSLRWASRRLSSSVFWTSVSPTASGTSAILSQISPISSIRSAMLRFKMSFRATLPIPSWYRISWFKASAGRFLLSCGRQVAVYSFPL